MRLRRVAYAFLICSSLCAVVFVVQNVRHLENFGHILRDKSRDPREEEMVRSTSVSSKLTKYTSENHSKPEITSKTSVRPKTTNSSAPAVVANQTAAVVAIVAHTPGKTVEVVPAEPVKKQPLTSTQTHACALKLQQIGRQRIIKCTILFGYMSECLTASAIGQEPLPNFYLRSSDEGSEADYKQANVGFVHMPKSGGTSVEEVLMRIPGLNVTGDVMAKRIAHCYEVYAESKHQLEKKDPRQTLYFSKRTYGIHNYVYPERPFAYVTWFREPISRLVSTYYYAKRKNCFGVHKICVNYMAKTPSLTHYLQKHPTLHFQDMDNFYVRLLQYGDFPQIDTTFEDCCGGVELKDAFKIPAVEEKHYLIAKKNLETQMAFVGITEDFKTSQDMLAHIFSIPIKEEVHINTNPHKYNLSDYELKELRKRNIWDLKLYEDAMAIYQRQKKVYLERYLKVNATSNTKE